MNFSKQHQATILTDFAGSKSPFHVYPQEWHENKITFFYEDERTNTQGFVVFHADSGALEIGPQSLIKSTQAKLDFTQEQLISVCRIFLKHYLFGHSPSDEEMPSYDADYHSVSGYLEPNEHELSVKRFQAGVIQKMASPKKCLVAGCSSGELVHQLRLLGVEAFGFDIMHDLDKHARADVRMFLKSGSVQNVPFATDDVFDTLPLIDVLEHIPEKDIDQVIAEWRRLGVRQVVTLINHNEFHFRGHVTLRPPPWWQQKWQPHFVQTTSFQLDKETLYHNDHDSNHVWRLLTKTQSK